MPNWNEVLKEIQESPRRDALDDVRRKYLGELAKLTGRNTIAYYSGFLQKPNAGMTEINDDDKNGFMATIHKMDRKIGLDLILHTPGGNLAATESLVFYLKEMFGTDIRAIVPQIAMSAGTMIACACKEILMGKNSNIGPIDPQFSGIPAHGVIEEFEKALEEVRKDPASIPIWQTIIGKYHPTFLGECEKAIQLSSEMVKTWLKSNMLSTKEDNERLANEIVEQLNNHEDTLTHSRHIHYDQAKELGLVIKLLEEEGSELQDKVLTVHHAFMHTLAGTSVVKIIENQNGVAVVTHQQAQQVS